MKKFIAFSGGVESTTMCILYGLDAIALWCDTGCEEKVMYDRIDFVEQKINEIHSNRFKLIRIKPIVNVKGTECSSLNELAMAYKYFPSPTSRYCTRTFKIKPIDEYLINQGECELMIGFNADEDPGRDRTGNYMKCKNVRYRYPLYDDGLDRRDCGEILKQHDLNPSFPPYMKRGGCTHCFYKGRSELKAKYLYDPDGFMSDLEFEKQLQHRREKFYYINMNAGGSYKTIKEEVDKELKMWGRDEVMSWYDKVNTHKPCGAFCHR